MTLFENELESLQNKWEELCDENLYHKWDKIVLKFIDSDSCANESDLTKFIISNKLPPRECWYYYAFGKFRNHPILSKKFSRENLSNEYIETKYLDVKLYYWKDYLNREEALKSELGSQKENIKDQNYIDDPRQWIHDLYLKKGYDYINNMIEMDEYAESHNDEADYSMEENYNDEPSRCPACQESPCMCSDPY